MEYTVIRSDRRTVAVQITPEAQVLVRAPQRMTAEQIEAFLQRHRRFIEKHVKAQSERREKHPEPTSAEAQALRKMAQEIIPQRIAKYAAVMGVQPTAVRITSAKTRFGSCNGKNALCFSWRLMQYPLEAVDYVVVHELAHIRHHNHSAAFYAFVESILPDYRTRAALLRE